MRQLYTITLPGTTLARKIMLAGHYKRKQCETCYQASHVHCYVIGVAFAMVVGITRSQHIPIPKISTDVPGPAGQRILVADALQRTPSVRSQRAEPLLAWDEVARQKERTQLGAGARRTVFVVSSLLLSGESHPRRHLDAAEHREGKVTNQPTIERTQP